MKYADLVALQNKKLNSKNSSFSVHAVSKDVKPKKCGRGDTHRYESTSSFNNSRMIKSVIDVTEKYGVKKYFPCVQCGRYVGIATRRNQKRGSKGYSNLLCKLHLLEI